jgi:sterol desaturase/sphingolipid hydroxylase (fatty acid hydroxylase superfamily)
MSSYIAWYQSNATILFLLSLLGALFIEAVQRLIHHYRFDASSTATSIVSGGAFLLAKTIVGKLVVVELSLWVFDNFRLFTLALSNPWIWLAVFIARDALYYWVHRAEHRSRVLWASHLVHHSPTTIGVTTAVRVPWMEAVYKPWLGLWVPLIGFHPLAFVALDILAATIGQLQHTTLYKRRTILDLIFVTPSSHRVHHGSNSEYIDKNFGAVFIIWDRLFDTYQKETVPVVYGIGKEKAIETAADALLGGYPDLLRQAKQKRSFSDSVKYMLAPPGSTVA